MDDILRLPALEAAPKLLGYELARNTPGGIIRVKIVETEAYNQDDPASHSYRGITKRTAPMFEAGGHLYVYFTYGMHYCLNLVVGEQGRGEAVLIRAAEPVEGIEIMKKFRKVSNDLLLTSGPARLTQALGIISTELSGKLISKDTLDLLPPKVNITAQNIGISGRIGINTHGHLPWRFFLKNNPFVTKHRLNDEIIIK